MKTKTIGMAMSILLTATFLTSCNGTSSVTSSDSTSTADNSSISINSTANSATVSSLAVSSAATSSVAVSSAVQKTFTAAELAKFDGQNGNAAYIAVDGVVYDVTNVSQWKNGLHRGGQFKAGVDVSAIFKSQSPHGNSIFSGVPVVGTFVK